jgi:hypothetical protein
MVAALGPKMMRHTVCHADIWNSLSFQPSFADQLAETRERIATLDRLCAELGREPATLQRSYTMFDPTARHNGGALSYYQSSAAFLAQVEPLLALGITDFGLYYPFLPEQVATFTEIATEILPKLRNYFTPERFSNDDAGFLAWVDAHPNGFVLNLDTNGPRKTVIHRVDCGWFTSSDPSEKHTSVKKACSDWEHGLTIWGEREGHTISRCNRCLGS